jgi:Heparinase II/III-like protein/Heparinase II/III N-terminus
MGPAEIGGRTRQAVAKWVDRHIGPLHGPGRHHALTVPAGPSPGFFPGAVDRGTIALLDRRAPGARGRILETAEAVLEGKFDLLGYRKLEFGDPLDWHLDPVSGRRAGLRHWSTIDPLDERAVGDSKVIWELNRHQWLVRLGQAHRLTGDERFADAFVAHVNHWMVENPRGMGINWASSLEVAIRLMSWSWALHLFQGSAVVGREARMRIFRSLEEHASHVARYLSYYFSPNTHLTGEALGLFYAGALFPTLPGAGRWQALGKRILEEQSGCQLLADGVYFERSTCYQRYTAEIYLQFLVLAEMNGLPVPSDVRQRIASLLDALLVLLGPDRSMPQIGDADGGWLLPLDVRAANDARGVFSTAAVVFRRDDYAWAAGGLAPETLWLLGPTASDIFDSLRPTPPGGVASRALPDGGYVVLRSSWRPDADQVVLDTGALGCSYSAGHGHADLLGIQCTFRGQAYVVDPGTFRYTTDAGWRSYFRGTAAHSTVEVDRTGQARPRAAFAWDARPGARLLRWETGDALDFAEAEHGAYAHLAEPVLHRRMVVLVRSGYCVVVDDLEGQGEHRLDLRFQLAPMALALGADQWIRAGQTAGPGLLVRAFATVPLNTTIAEGEMDPLLGWVSTDYGVKTPAPMVTYSVVGRLPVRLLTVLLPTDHLSDSPRVSPLAENGKIQGLVLSDRGEALYLDGPIPSLKAA